MTVVNINRAFAALQARGELTAEHVYELHKARLAAPQTQMRASIADEPDTSELEAATADLGREVRRAGRIMEMGEAAGMPKLAAELIRTGVSVKAAFERICAAQDRRREKKIAAGWEAAFATLQPGAAKPDKPLPDGWAKAIDTIKAERSTAVSTGNYGWDAAIASIKGGR